MTIEAVVIKKIPIREHDALVVLYSRELGKCAAVAKSALKTSSVQAGHLDIGNSIHCELVSGRSAPIITAAQATRCWSSAKSSGIRGSAMQFFLHVIDAIVYDDEPDPVLFTTLMDALEALEAAPDERAVAVFRHHQAQMLHVLGYGRYSVSTPVRAMRTDIDDAYERIANRTLHSLDLLYELAGK